MEVGTRLMYFMSLLVHFTIFPLGGFLHILPRLRKLSGDVKFNRDSCMIHIRNPKSKKKEGEFVDLFIFFDSSVCPVKNLNALHKETKFPDDKKPVFLFANGNLLTPAVLNDTIRSLLASHLGKKLLQSLS